MSSFEVFHEELIKYVGDETKVIVPNGITYIKDFAFAQCKNIVEIIIPESVTRIGDYAFHECDNLVKVDMPNTIISIGNGAFSCCRKIESIDIPCQIRTIGRSVFYRCPMLKTINMPPIITKIERSAFSLCTSLQKITLPRDLKVIGETAFQGCTSLKELILPEGVTTIHWRAFFNCPKLRKLVLSKKLNEVADHAFETGGKLEIISNNDFLLRPVMFDNRWNLNWNTDLKIRFENNYQLFNSFLPNVDPSKWKPYGRVVVIVNFLETIAMHKDFTIYEAALKLQYKDVLDFLIEEKRYIALNNGIENQLINPKDVEPYFNQVHDREQLAKLMEYSKENNNALDDLENELFNMF